MPDSPLAISQISPRTVRRLAASYAQHSAPSLGSLDRTRYVDVPEQLRRQRSAHDALAAQRRTHDEPARHVEAPHVTRAQLGQLMEWKLKRGTFRPRLQELVESNAAATVRETTGAALARLFSAGGETPSSEPAVADVLAALDMLTPLKGVGPATASLVLSCADPVGTPFFSDELFRWVVHVDGDRAETGWEAKIGYTRKEYGVLCEKVAEVRKRLREEEETEGKDEDENEDEKEDITAVDLEKAAYVLRRQQVEKNSWNKTSTKKAAPNLDTEVEAPRATKKRKVQGRSRG